MTDHGFVVPPESHIIFLYFHGSLLDNWSNCFYSTVCQGLPRWLSGKGSAANAGNGPWGQDSPLEKEMATQLQYFYLENPMDGRARQATVHGVARSRT